MKTIILRIANALLFSAGIATAITATLSHWNAGIKPHTIAECYAVVGIYIVFGLLLWRCYDLIIKHVK